MENKSLSTLLLSTCLFVISACGSSDNDEVNSGSAVAASYSLPTADPAGLTFDGSVLWMSGDDDPGMTYQPMLYRIDPTNGALIEKITPPVQVSYTGGLAWNGSYLTLFDGIDIHYLDTSGGYVSSFTAATGLWPDNLAYDGTDFWGSDGFETVSRFDNAGNIINSFILSGNLTANGLAWSGSHLWVAGASSSTINKLDTSGKVQDSIDLGIDFPWLHDLAFDGSHLWVIEDIDDRLYQLNTD